MNEPKLRMAGIETPDAEVELSAEDLLELSGPRDNNEAVQEPRAKTKIVSIETSAPVPQRRAAPAATRPMSFLGVAASLTLAVGLAIAAYFVMKASEHAARSVAQERAPQSQLPVSSPESEGEPVLFANPFDAKEVFEFPAGTSEAQARDAVAEILMERAMERQRQFDARVSDNR